jgi:hypothetical protein
MKQNSKIKSVRSFSHVRIDPSRVTFNSNITEHNRTEKGTRECHGKCCILLGYVVCSFFFWGGGGGVRRNWRLKN